MREIGAFEAKNTLGSLLDLVQGGEEVVITRHGKPVARLVRETVRGDARERARRAAEAIDQLSQDITLGGHSIKALIEEGWRSSLSASALSTKAPLCLPSGATRSLTRFLWHNVASALTQSTAGASWRPWTSSASRKTMRPKVTHGVPRCISPTFTGLRSTMRLTWNSHSAGVYHSPRWTRPCALRLESLP